MLCPLPVPGAQRDKKGKGERREGARGGGCTSPQPASRAAEIGEDGSVG